MTSDKLIKMIGRKSEEDEINSKLKIEGNIQETTVE